MNEIRLFIISDLENVQKGLATIFSSSNFYKIIYTGGCNQESLSFAQQTQPDAILYGFKQGIGGSDIIRQIKEVCPNSKIFVIIDPDISEELLEIITAGVDGCLVNTMLPCHLMGAVELTCKAGVLCLPLSLNRLLGNRNDSCGNDQVRLVPVKTGGNGNGGCGLPLTVREKEIYKLIIKNYSNKEIGKVLFISEPTVKTHVSYILST